MNTPSSPKIPPTQEQPTFDWLSILCVAGVALLLTISSGGIGIGTSNHVGLLPVVRRILDPNYLPGDFGIAVRYYHHRVFAYLIAALSMSIGENNALIALNVVGKLFLSYALWHLCRTLGLSRRAFLIGGALIAAHVGWTGLGLELNDFVGDREVMPPLFAHALMLYGVSFLLRDRLLAAALCVGFTLLIHLQIGIILALILLPFYLVKPPSFSAREIASYALAVLVPSSFSLWHLGQMMRRGLDHESFSLDYINYRHPHHFELISTEAAVWTIVHVLIVTGAYLYLRRAGGKNNSRIGRLAMLCWLLAGLALLHFLDYYVLGRGVFVKFQFIRMSSTITVFGSLALLCVWQRWNASARAATEAGGFLKFAPNLLLAAIVVGWIFYYSATLRRSYYFGVTNYAGQKSNWVEMCRWIAERGPTAGMFLTPPGNNGFTYLTNRSHVVEFKINPDGGLFLAEWYERLRDLAGGTLPEVKGLPARNPLNRAYAALNPEQMRTLGEKYGANYAIVSKKSAAAASFEVLHENAEYALIVIK